MTWISVKDRLPEEGEPILMHCTLSKWWKDDPATGGHLQLGIFINGKFCADKPDWSDGFAEGITHWMKLMPLPEPPESKVMPA